MKYPSWAVASLLLGIFSFVTVFGLEKAVLAVVFGYLAIRELKGKKKAEGRILAYIGIVLGIVAIVLIAVMIPTVLSYYMQMAV